MERQVLCPRLRIRETTEEPTLMQTHECLFTSSSLGPSVPNTAEQGLGPRGGFQLSFKGWSRGPLEGVEQFLKFCLHFDIMGLSRALSSVLILIGASCPWLGLCFYSNMGLSRTLSCKLFSSCNWSKVKFSSYSQGPGMAVLVLTLNLKWNGLNFLSLHISPSQRNLRKDPIMGPGWSQSEPVGMSKSWFKPTLLLFSLCLHLVKPFLTFAIDSRTIPEWSVKKQHSSFGVTHNPPTLACKSLSTVKTLPSF